jgi:small multidrug resistance pump
MALKKIDVSVAYAIWAMNFKEPLTRIKIISISLVIMGVVGINLSSGGP